MDEIILPAHPGLHVDVEGPVIHLRIERPERRNAIDRETLAALDDALARANTDPSCRCLVLTGTDRDFCTGADVGPASTVPGPLDYRFAPEPYLQFTRRLWELEVPVVTAVTGTVAGFGWVLALCGDLVVARDDARWTHVFSRRGMVPHAGDPALLPHMIPFHRLNEIALLSEPVTSAELHGWGVIARSVPAADVLPAATEIATRLAAGPTRSLGLTKQLYRRSLISGLSRSFDDERAAIALASTTHDRHEGVRSLVERRAPRFRGA